MTSKGTLPADRHASQSAAHVPATQPSRGTTLFTVPHRRYDPLLDQWVLVAAERNRRPWRGRTEPPPAESVAAYDPECYLCPGNARANGETNPDYESTFVFTNDFAALRPQTAQRSFNDGLLRAQTEAGTCRVLCFSRSHNLTLAKMGRQAVREVVDLWAEQTAELGERFSWVQIFENRGETMGASNPHPHGQIWAGSALPTVAEREDATQLRHWRATGQALLLDHVAAETGGPRSVIETPDWIALVPFWAAWPYETLLVATRPVSWLSELEAEERSSLADVLVDLLSSYDRLFGVPFPYSMGWHQAPFRGPGGEPHWQLHAHFYPPLLGATVRKFMVGYELLSEAQRDLTPEQAAETLRQAR